MLTHDHPLQVWLGFMLVWPIYSPCDMWMFDVFPSLQRGFHRVLPLSSLCYEGNELVISFAVQETSSSPPIRIAIWERDMRIVVLTGSFFLANLAGLLYGKIFWSTFGDWCSDPSIHSSQGKFSEPISQWLFLP